MTDEPPAEAGPEAGAALNAEPPPVEPPPTVETPLSPEPPSDATAPSPDGPAAAYVPPLTSTRRLVGASFDLLAGASEEMRAASFYIGAIVLGTVGPFALASWVLEVTALHRTVREADELMSGGAGGWYGLLAVPALIGGLVALVESRTMAAAILGGRLAGRPVTVREALARSRMVFWRAVVASLVAGVPLAVAQGALEAVLAETVNLTGEATVVVSLIVTALIGAPLAYLLAGVVLGDVDPLEATRRSFRVFRARKIAAVVVALIETTTGLLILFGLEAGLDIALRLLDALGLGVDSGPAGLTLVTLGVAAATFALGTLIYTVTAIALAPQVVMFVGLTHATIGLDHVRPGGDHAPDRAPDRARPGQRPFRMPARGMVVAIIASWLLLVPAAGLMLR
jgi:hypothetical protein